MIARGSSGSVLDENMHCVVYRSVMLISVVCLHILPRHCSRVEQWVLPPQELSDRLPGADEAAVSPRVSVTVALTAHKATLSPS